MSGRAEKRNAADIRGARDVRRTRTTMHRGHRLGILDLRPWRPFTPSAWHADGPLLPVEFCRGSRGGKITLVLTLGMPRVMTLWATLATRDLGEARQLLADREARP